GRRKSACFFYSHSLPSLDPAAHCPFSGIGFSSVFDFPFSIFYFGRRSHLLDSRFFAKLPAPCFLFFGYAEALNLRSICHAVCRPSYVPVCHALRHAGMRRRRMPAWHAHCVRG
ncbi:MAG TPA: hypothetical protein VL860_07385, partial [Planctomycetota bacterium]|nr:hypothetical protein [Planctomycetota bacterium]